jgi:flavin reductase (DIM6/NTAB) family NADH-FMN oxidoreductase RutF
MPGNADLRRALALFPQGEFLLTAAFENRRAGVFVRSAQQCAEVPLMVCVVTRKGHSLEPLIRDSRCFAVCLVDPEDRLLHKTFGPARMLDAAGDPFDSIEVERLATGSPVPRRTLAAVDCQLVRHLDLEADHEVYIGLVVAGWAARMR